MTANVLHEGCQRHRFLLANSKGAALSYQAQILQFTLRRL
jgi:hypothetical protein